MKNTERGLIGTDVKEKEPFLKATFEEGIKWWLLGSLKNIFLPLRDSDRDPTLYNAFADKSIQSKVVAVMISIASGVVGVVLTPVYISNTIRKDIQNALQK